MEFASLNIFDFSGFRFYYGLGDTQAYILVETEQSLFDLNSGQKFEKDKINALLRLINPEVTYIHDNLEVRLDKRRVSTMVEQYPDYAIALRSELEKLSIFASNLRFYQDSLVNKIEEIIDDYSGTKYHETSLDRRHFVGRLISNFDRYIKLDELPLNWVNFMDCLAQVPTKNKIQVFNTWRSFLVIKNYSRSTYPKLYYKFNWDLLTLLEQDPEVDLIHLNEDNIDTILNSEMIRVQDSSIVTTNPVRNI